MTTRTAVITNCDRCGDKIESELTDPRNTKPLPSGWAAIKITPYNADVVNMDLCARCSNEFMRVVKGKTGDSDD